MALRLVYLGLILEVILSAHGSPLFRPVPRLQLDNGRIVGGEETTIERVPYIVAVLFGSQHGCGGSIIQANVILTAAHCLEETTVSQVSIRAGSSNKNTGGQVLQLSNMISHPAYNPNNYHNDIAVLKLSSNIVLGSTARIIPMTNQGQAVADGTMSRVSGWGLTIPDDMSSLPQILRTVLVPTVGNAACNAAYLGLITEDMLCAGYMGVGGKDACQNDSGGPLEADNVLIGVVSWGNGCADPSYPGVYAKVSHFRNWIDGARK